MKVSIWPIRATERWGNSAGGWRETTSHFIVILINIRENNIFEDVQMVYSSVIGINYVSEL